MNKIIITQIVFLISLLASCKDQYKYSGSIKIHEHPWLKDKKIFIDPGHGGKGKSDRFRIGPGGITEEEINLRVALILNDMLTNAGAKTKLSRNRDVDIDLDSRIEMAKIYQPDLLLSIHHNGSPRRQDNVNYGCVIIWGSDKVRPASYDLAGYLQYEFNKIIPEKGKIISDFSVFHETGTRILRRTRYLCPGVIGEAGFFSHEEQAKRLIKINYNMLEAEAYFKAASKFFKNSSPEPEVLFSCRMNNSGYLSNMIKNRNPVIALRIPGKSKNHYPHENSIEAALDNIKIKMKKKSPGLFLFDYGKTLYSGGHRIKFQFKNKLNQRSMIYTVPFTVEIKKGDFDFLKKTGIQLIENKKNISEGIKMLSSALSMGLTDPEADELIYEISRGFNMIGDKANSEYYLKKLYYFYPESKLRSTIENDISLHNRYRYPVEYHGKRAKIIGSTLLK